MDKDRVVGAVKDVAGKAQGAIGDAVESDRDSLEGRVREAEGQAQNLYGQAKDAVRNVAGEVSGYAEEAYDRGSRYVSGGRREVVNAVAEYPLTIVLAAGLLGFGLGLLARGRD